MTAPLCSVIMAVYNHEKYVAEAVRSVLLQTHTNIEFIVVDDHSSDASYEIVLELAKSDDRLRVIRNAKNEGCSVARNNGLQHATGEYIAFIDSDDIWNKEKIERQILFLEQAQVDVCYTAYSRIDSSGKILCDITPVPTQADLVSLLKNNFIIFSSVCCKRCAIDGVFFDKSYVLEDFLFWIQLLQRGCKFGGINEDLLEYRMHPSGRSFNKFNAAWHRWKIYRDYLKLSLPSALYYFSAFALSGLRKHGKFFLLSLRS